MHNYSGPRPLTPDAHSLTTHAARHTVYEDALVFQKELQCLDIVGLDSHFHGGHPWTYRRGVSDNSKPSISSQEFGPVFRFFRLSALGLRNLRTCRFSGTLTPPPAWT